MCDDCCICPQTTWQFMFLDNMIIRSNHPKNLAFLEHRNHPLHITFWRLFFSLQACSTGVEIQIRRVDEHSSQLWAMGWTGWVWTAIAMKNKIRWVHFRRIQNLILTCQGNERNLHAMVNSPFIVHLHASYRDALFVSPCWQALIGISLDQNPKLLYLKGIPSLQHKPCNPAR